jgi:hypothetical protein
MTSPHFSATRLITLAKALRISESVTPASRSSATVSPSSRCVQPQNAGRHRGFDLLDELLDWSGKRPRAFACSVAQRSVCADCECAKRRKIAQAQRQGTLYAKR